MESALPWLAVGTGVSVGVGLGVGVGIAVGLAVGTGVSVGAGLGIGVAVGLEVAMDIGVGAGLRVRLGGTGVGALSDGKIAATVARTCASTVAPRSGVGAGVAVGPRVVQPAISISVTNTGRLLQFTRLLYSSRAKGWNYLRYLAIPIPHILLTDQGPSTPRRPSPPFANSKATGQGGSAPPRLR